MILRIPRPRLPHFLLRLPSLVPIRLNKLRDKGDAIVPSGIKAGRVEISDINLDEVRIGLCGVEVFVRRWITTGVPHEVSAFIPRAEIEVKRSPFRKVTKMTLNSITIVHAPRFPPTGR
jgi:hypothetical protein